MYFWKYILTKKAGLSQQKCNMALYGLPVLPIAEAFEKTLTGNPITITDALAQDALSLQVTFEPTQDGTPSIDSESTTEPYLSKVIPRGNKEYYSLVGGTVAWNQQMSAGPKDISIENSVMNIKWDDGNTNYDMPLNLCHLETVKDAEDNDISVADFESHYVLPFDCVFDETEAIIAGDTDLAAGDYYFKIANDSWGNNNGKYVLFSLDTDLVAGQQIRKKSGAYNAAIEDCTLGIFTSGSDRTGAALAFTVQTTQPESGTNLGRTDGTGWCNFWHCVVLGYNRWKYSAVRQFLNSDATAGNWWTQQHKWDVMPAYATTKSGFLYGITAGVKEHLKETKVYTARNTVFNSGDTPLGSMDETLDKVFLISLEQSWIEPQISGEGTYWEYYKNLLGTNTPVARSQTYPLLIKYDLAAKTTARARWLRSCNRGYASYDWYVYSSGYVNSNSAYSGLRVAPCLRIGTSDLENYKIPSNHKYLLKYGSNYSLGIGTGECVNILKNTNDYVTDLTLMFANNPAIADYAYSLEQSTAGSGIAWLRSYGFFTEDYYPYNPGELISVNTSGHKIGSTTYSIDPTDLRGLFKLDSANKLYCDGDTYKSNGTVTRNFEYRAYQSGDESLADAITDGTHTVVKLTTPTTETATPYTSPIDVEAGGTEEFVDGRTVPIPVGNETYYASEYAVHGKTGVTVSHGATEDDPNPTEYEVEFTSQGTVYGGTVDIVSGELSVTWGYIASYNGETLTGEWMSSKDVYAEGTSPSTGAEVAYELATPLTYQLTPQQVQMLLNDNYLTTPDGTITITYMAGK